VGIASNIGADRVLVAIWVAPAIIVVLIALASRRVRPAMRWKIDRAIGVLIAAYAIGVIAITLYPFSFDVEPGRILDRGNWVPFGGTLGFLISDNSLRVQIASRDFLANIALFAPVGLLLGSRTRHGRDVVLAMALLVGMAFALEVVQGLTVAERTLDIDDAIAGSIGAVGAVLVGSVLPLETTSRKRLYA
jgi:glycopeptide antibiotics resistance protein